MKILIVEDSRAMQTIIKRAIEQLEFPNIDFRKAHNGLEALDIIRAWEPTLILSDWHMPELNGFEMLSELNRQMLDIQVGFITSETSKTRKDEALAAGARFFIQKPFKFSTLHQIVKPILELNEKQNKLGIEKQEVEFIKAPDLSELSPIDTKNESSKQKAESIENTDNAVTLPKKEKILKSLSSFLSSEIKIVNTDSIKFTDKNFPCLVGTFKNENSNSLRAIAVLDHQASCILSMGITSNKIDLSKIKTETESNLISNKVINNCQKIMQVFSTLLYDEKIKQNLTFQKITILRENSKEVEKLLSKSNDKRINLNLKIDSTEAGKLTLIAS